jgi:microsomal dipeptidase-like Zn-dependent dipeptidase
MKDLTELRELRARLTKRFSKTQVDGVMGGNWIEFLGRSLPD